MESFKGDRSSAEMADDLDYKNKKVIVIGSAPPRDADPAIRGEMRHVTMLQRSRLFQTGRNAIEIAETCAPSRSTRPGS